jgi:hypothetical protein
VLNKYRYGKERPAYQVSGEHRARRDSGPYIFSQAQVSILPFNMNYHKKGQSRDNSVAITTGYGVGSPGSIPGKPSVSLLHSVHIGSWAHTVS